MTLSYEGLLVIGILAFYLYDSAMLLFFNDIIFVERYGTWSFACPSDRWQILGKLLYFPNPLKPDASLFRLTWSTDSQTSIDSQDEATERLIKALNPLRYLALGLLFIMIFGLPVVILILGTGLWFYILLAAIYITILLMLFYSYWRKGALGISRRVWATLAFEIVLCPPFALNIVRKLTLKHVLTSNPIDFARRYFMKESFHKLIHSVQMRLNEELELVDSDSHRSAEIRAYSVQLNELSK